MVRFYILILAGFFSSNVSAQSTHTGAAESNATASMADALDAHIYPNPVSSTLYLTISEKMSGCTIRIYNLLGSEVVNYETSGAQNTIDVSTIQEGIYLYRIIDKNDKIILTGRFNKK